MILKLQRSLFTNNEKEQFLAYNKSKSILYQCDLSDDLKNLFGEDFKIYVKAKLYEQGLLILGKRISNQNW